MRNHRAHDRGGFQRHKIKSIYISSTLTSAHASGMAEERGWAHGTTSWVAVHAALDDSPHTHAVPSGCPASDPHDAAAADAQPPGTAAVLHRLLESFVLSDSGL